MGSYQMQKNIFIIATIFLIIEIYAYQAFKTLVTNTIARYVYWGVTLLVYGILFYELYHFNKSVNNPRSIQLVVSLFVIFLLPKVLILVFLILDDLFRILSFGISKISNSDAHFPERRTFLSVLGLGMGGLLSGLFIDGIIFGKYRHKVRKVKLKIAGLPKSFKGYKIVQISDVHSGSFFHPEKLQHAIDLINQQHADLVLFTGDMVNALATEFEPFIPLFSTIKSKDGKFSVLGNHDYGTYFNGWKSNQERLQNIETLIKHEQQAGFKMLRNEHHIIEKNGEQLYIIGVENWGEKPFPQFGDLDKATENIPPSAAKILMSHDPTHFDRIVKKHSSNVQLTLSGHTHGMQFGLDLKNVKWSPVQYKYPKWADLYESMGKYLYVNRGFGVIGYPGRVGVLPEITLIELS